MANILVFITHISSFVCILIWSTWTFQEGEYAILESFSLHSSYDSCYQLIQQHHKFVLLYHKSEMCILSVKGVLGKFCCLACRTNLTPWQNHQFNTPCETFFSRNAFHQHQFFLHLPERLLNIFCLDCLENLLVKLKIKRS